jgi:hypothetical protein
MKFSIRLIHRSLLLATLALGLSACKSEPAKPRHQRNKDNVLEEYVKVPLDKAKDLKNRSDQSSAGQSKVYDELGEN